MKTFYTIRDIEDMHAAGVVEIQIHDDVVVTDVAREKAVSLGMRLVPVEENQGSSKNRRKARGSSGPRAADASSSAGTGSSAIPSASQAPASSRPQPGIGGTDAELVRKVKAGVIARLGTDKYNGILDQIIPQVISKLKK